MKFEQDDFKSSKFPEFSMFAEWAAMCANKKFSKWLDAAPVVFSGPDKDLGKDSEDWTLKQLAGYDTHKAKVVCVEKI